MLFGYLPAIDIQAEVIAGDRSIIVDDRGNGLVAVAWAVDVEHADLIPNGWHHWVQSDRATGYDIQNPAWVSALEADAGKTLGFSRLVARVLPAEIGNHPTTLS